MRSVTYCLTGTAPCLWQKSSADAHRNTPRSARAFAAELLLPRETAAAEVRKTASLSMAIEHLHQNYRVSRALLGWQISNSSVMPQMDADDRALITRMTLSP